MSTVDFKPFAANTGANVESQANYAGSSHQLLGFTNGIADPQKLNKVWRQSSMMAAALAGFISTQLSADVLDDGNLPGLKTQLTDAIEASATSAVTSSVYPDLTAAGSDSSGGCFVIPKAVIGGDYDVYLQWKRGVTDIGTGVATQTITFKKQFPNACLFAGVCMGTSDAANTDIMSYDIIGTPSTSTVTVGRFRRGDNGSRTTWPIVFAIGM